MGRICPECNTYQPQVRVITADFKPARKAEDVIAVELGCGHVIGEEEYKAFAAARQKILAKLEADKKALINAANAQLAEEYKKMKAAREAKQ